jgi:hypothetical protein
VELCQPRRLVLLEDADEGAISFIRFPVLIHGLHLLVYVLFLLLQLVLAAAEQVLLIIVVSPVLEGGLAIKTTLVLRPEILIQLLLDQLLKHQHA